MSRARILQAARDAARAGDEAKARELFALVGISYVTQRQLIPVVPS